MRKVLEYLPIFFFVGAVGIPVLFGIYRVIGAWSAPPPPPPPPSSAPRVEECTAELVADYEEREYLIADLLIDLQECRERFGGCEPDSHWVLKEGLRRFRDDHPEIVEREKAERRQHAEEIEALVREEEASEM